jgi:hypothetical protein
VTRRYVLPLVFGAVIAMLGTAALVLRAMGSVPAEPAPDPTRQVLLFQQPSAPADAMVAIACNGQSSACVRLAADMARRRPVDGDARTAAAPVIQQFSLLPPGYLDADQYRAVLLAAGFQDVVVRLARPGDPAPEGVLEYAVGAGQACVVGWRVAKSPGLLYVAGRLPSGTCLDL